MGSAAGFSLRLLGTLVRFLQLACAAIILGIFSYFLAALSRQGLYQETWIRAVEGISGAGVLYGLFGVLLTFFLGGFKSLAFVAMVLDVAFLGAFIAVAIETRGGAQNCDNLMNEDSLRFGANGLGDPYAHDYVPTTYHACTLLKTTFILSIIGAFLYLISIFTTLAIARHHQREETRRPAPNTVHPVATKRSFFSRRPKHAVIDPETGRVSHESHLTGNTAIGNTYEPKPAAVNY